MFAVPPTDNDMTKMVEGIVEPLAERVALPRDRISGGFLGGR